MQLEKGYCFVVTGHPYYGRNAYCLAMSIKAMNPDAQIAVMYNGTALNHLGPDQFEFFDHVIKMPDHVPPNPICKLYGAQMSPFDKTIVLDADTLWLPFKDPIDVFDIFGDAHFSGITEGKEDDPHPNYYFWADVGEIKSKYTFKTMMHQWRSEFIYFDREGRSIIDRALEIVLNPDLKTVMKFALNVPDELGINIATAEAGIVPHEYKWQPTYWPLMHNHNVPALAVMGAKHYLMSFGSNRASDVVRRAYDQIMGSAATKLERKHVFPLIQKRDFLPKERNLM